MQFADLASDLASDLVPDLAPVEIATSESPTTAILEGEDEQGLGQGLGEGLGQGLGQGLCIEGRGLGVRQGQGQGPGQEQRQGLGQEGSVLPMLSPSKPPTTTIPTKQQQQQQQQQQLPQLQQPRGVEMSDDDIRRYHNDANDVMINSIPNLSLLSLTLT